MAMRVLEKLVQKKDLSIDESRGLMISIMSGELRDTQIAAIITALRMKGETVDEITGFASAMREKAISVHPRRKDLVDTCGTGGDLRHTFNVSTATALVAASMGISVAKHGNRAVSSKCGSADVLEALGVNIQLPPESTAELIDRVGIGFLFAPRHHPAMKHAALARKELAIRTIFNLLGPLTNPAGVKRQLIGVFDKDLTEVLCGVLRALGSEKAFVVHGMDGTDEVSITGETAVSVLEKGEIKSFLFTPEEAGLDRAGIGDISGGSAEQNAVHITDILNGRCGPRRDAVLLNAGFVAGLAGVACDVRDGVRLAKESIESGKARELLDQLREASRELAG
jgi:anthranilate phosphoribosyltransferase